MRPQARLEKKSGVRRSVPIPEPFASGIEFAVAANGELVEADVRRVGSDLARDYSAHLDILPSTEPELAICILICERLKAERQASLRPTLSTRQRSLLRAELRAISTELVGLTERQADLTRRKLELQSKLGTIADWAFQRGVYANG